jgi:hypothetical protein
VLKTAKVIAEQSLTSLTTLHDDATQNKTVGRSRSHLATFSFEDIEKSPNFL